jgi:phosphatidylinositol alpha-1,6-mannosyltransferase
MIVITTQNFHPDVGGIEIYLTGLADTLAARGHKLAVFCDGPASADDVIKPYQIFRFQGPRPWSRWRKSVAVQRFVRKEKVEAVIADTWKSLTLLPAASLENARVVCLAHGAEFLVPPGSAKHGRIVRALAKADIVAANSAFTGALVKPFLTQETEMRVVLPGLYPPLTKPEKRGASKNRVLTIARLDAYKGVDVMLRAVAALKEKFPALHYDIVGTGDETANLNALADQLGIDAHVQFHGRVSESGKAQLLEQADVFALPSRLEPNEVEGFGIVFAEAGAYGLPCLAGRDGGIPSAVLDGETGLLVDGGDVAQVTQALSRLLADDDLAERLGRAGYERFWNEFVWDAAIPRFEAALFGPL